MHAIDAPPAFPPIATGWRGMDERVRRQARPPFCRPAFLHRRPIHLGLILPAAAAAAVAAAAAAVCVRTAGPTPAGGLLFAGPRPVTITPYLGRGALSMAGLVVPVTSGSCFTPHKHCPH